jgi:hypothetical protein
MTRRVLVVLSAVVLVFAGVRGLESMADFGWLVKAKLRGVCRSTVKLRACNGLLRRDMGYPRYGLPGNGLGCAHVLLQQQR